MPINLDVLVPLQPSVELARECLVIHLTPRRSSTLRLRYSLNQVDYNTGLLQYRKIATLELANLTPICVAFSWLAPPAPPADVLRRNVDPAFP